MSEVAEKRAEGYRFLESSIFEMHMQMLADFRTGIAKLNVNLTFCTLVSKDASPSSRM